MYQKSITYRCTVTIFSFVVITAWKTNTKRKNNKNQKSEYSKRVDCSLLSKVMRKIDKAINSPNHNPPSHKFFKPICPQALKP